MSWASDTKLRLQIFALGMAFLCPGFLIWLAPETMRQIASNRWPHVKGEVQQLVPEQSFDSESKRRLFFGRVQYTYVVNGKQYVSDLTDLEPGTKRSDPDSALADVARYHPGDNVAVYYDPNDPSVGIIETGISKARMILLSVLFVGALVCPAVSFFVVRGWWRAWSMARRSAVAKAATKSATIEPIDDQEPFDYRRPETLMGLGALEQMFGPARKNICAGIILGIAAVVGGLWLGYWTMHQPDNPMQGVGDRIGKYVFIGLFFGVLPVGGLFLTVWMFRRFSIRVVVGSDGLAYVYRGRAQLFPWRRIMQIRETLAHVSLPVLKLPGASVNRIARTIKVCRDDGSSFSFTANTIGKMNQLTTSLRKSSAAQNVPWQIKEIQ
jgi:hypothetical protein